MEKQDEIALNGSTPNAVGIAVKLKPLSNMSQGDKQLGALFHYVTDSINISDSPEEYMDNVSSGESKFTTFSSLNYGTLDDSVNELETKCSTSTLSGTESDDGFETLISPDTDDCGSSLCSRSECAE